MCWERQSLVSVNIKNFLNAALESPPFAVQWNVPYPLIITDWQLQHYLTTGQHNETRYELLSALISSRVGPHAF